ncbi:MAG: adenylate/guanylate cyclase domain-containing protein [Myxococcales bacterium]|nr:adenylate/guanylate cyclase domain-containing protein [Myxococcales bacterium]
MSGRGVTRLTRLGVDDALTGVDAQRVVLINVLALLGIAIIASLTAISAITRTELALAVQLSAAAVLLLVLWLHGRRRYWEAAVMIPLVVIFAGVARPLLALDLPGSHDFLIVNAMLPFLVLPVRFGRTAETLSLVSVLLCGLLTYRDATRYTYQELMALNTSYLQSQYVSMAVVMVCIGLFMRRINLRADAAAEAERARAELLLHDVLPAPIADAMIAGDGASARRHGDVSVLFANIEGFATIAAGLAPLEQVTLLDGLFRVYDDLCDRHGVEKIKSFGDVYMVASGLESSGGEHAERLTAFALELVAATEAYARRRGRALPLRVGIHSGPVVAGVIGEMRFTYDLWGDTVNTAQRMEANGVRGRVQVSFVTYSKINHKFRCELRDVIEIKGKIPMQTYLVRAPDGGRTP